MNTDRLAFLVLVSILLGVSSACGGDEPPPFASGGGSDGRDGEARDGGESGGGAGGEEGGTGGGVDGGESGSGEGGSGEGGGGEGGGEPVELPDSPSNPWIAFTRTDDRGFGQLFFVKSDGTGLTEYGGDLLSEMTPSWSPDGLLAFTAVHQVNGAELHVLDFAAGTDTVVDTGLVNMARPRWSPNGIKIVVTGKVGLDDANSLFSVDSIAGGNTQITESDLGDGGHDIAPDGTLYFVRKLGETDFDIFSIASTARPSDTPSRVTDGSSILGGVTVHPDGTKIVYARAAGATGTTTDLIERTLAGGSERTIGKTGDEEVDYYCGGDKMVLNRDSFDTDSEIAVTDTDGALETRCTDDPDLNGSPAVACEESEDVDVSQF